MPVSISYSASPHRAALVRAVGMLNALSERVANVARRWAERREAMKALGAIDERTLRDIGVRRPVKLSADHGERQ